MEMNKKNMKKEEIWNLSSFVKDMSNFYGESVSFFPNAVWMLFWKYCDICSIQKVDSLCASQESGPWRNVIQIDSLNTPLTQFQFPTSFSSFEWNTPACILFASIVWSIRINFSYLVVDFGRKQLHAFIVTITDAHNGSSRMAKRMI